MMDRQKLETLLTRRFPGATSRQIASTANAIMGLEDEWEEVASETAEFGFHFSGHCVDICAVAREAEDGAEFRILKRKIGG